MQTVYDTGLLGVYKYDMIDSHVVSIYFLTKASYLDIRSRSESNVVFKVGTCSNNITYLSETITTDDNYNLNMKCFFYLEIPQ